MNKVDLVIMAAGLGSRFGGLKQLETVGPYGATLLDYAIYDAFQVGIQNVYLVVRSSFHEAIKEAIQNKWGKEKSIFFVNQEIDDIPVTCPIHREKPWGTTHVLYALRDELKNPFIVMNADDYYGKAAISQLKNFLQNNTNNRQQTFIAYPLKNTLSGNGKVTRGVCQISSGQLQNIQEMRNVEFKEDQIQSDEKIIPNDAITSMNIWGLTPHFLKLSVSKTHDFFNSEKFYEKEVLIPETIQELISENEIEVKSIETIDNCFGMTFKEDLSLVQGKIAELIKSGQYPNNLFHLS